MTKKELKNLIKEVIIESNGSRPPLELRLSPVETDKTPVNIKLTKGVASQLLFMLKDNDVLNAIKKIGYYKGAVDVVKALTDEKVPHPVDGPFEKD